MSRRASSGSSASSRRAPAWGRGSGIVVAPGRVLTGAHALRGPEPTLTMGDGRRVTGRVLAVDPDRDVAVLEADTGEIRPVEWRPEDDDQRRHPAVIGALMSEDRVRRA